LMAAAPSDARLATSVDALWATLELRPIPAELREGDWALASARRGELAALVASESLRGDLHLHTHASDGHDDLETMVRAARARGLSYIAITEHSKSLQIANGLDADRMRAHLREIRRINAQFSDIEVLAGIEVDILADGQLDLPLELLEELDWVIASIHQYTKMDAATMTARIQAAMSTGVVDCIGHPTGRRPAQRAAYPLEFDRLVESAALHQVALECNGGPNRMDLDDLGCAAAARAGVMVAVNTDAHAAAHLGRFEYALAMARRGGLTPQQVLNAGDVDEIRRRRGE